jgi:hypothetical protein
MGIKQRLEDNIVVVVLSTAVTAFGTGFVASRNMAPNTAGGGDWQAYAKSNGWVERSECNAILVTLRILSPGDNSSVPFGSLRGTLSTDLVISSSQSIPTTAAMGWVVKIEGDDNYYVAFPAFTINDSRTLFRDTNPVDLPVRPPPPRHVDIWALLVDDKNKLGSIYGSLDQIKSAANVVLSEKIGFTTVPLT